MRPTGVRWAAVPILAMALTLAACGGKNTIRPDETAKTVTKLVVTKTGFHPTDVECPSGVEATVGKTFECHFTGPEGPYTAYMRVLSVDGESVNFAIRTRPTGASAPL